MVIRKRRNYRNRVYSNLKLYLDQLLVERGWYDNVASGETDWHGNNLSQLFAIQDDPRYPIDSGTSVHIWQGYKKNWVIESGMEPFTSGLTNPTIPRAIIIGGVSWPVRAFGGASGVAIDFRNGRVIVESGITFGTTVEVVHSEKYVWVDTISRDLISNQVTYIDNTKRVAVSEIPSGQISQVPMILMEMTASKAPQGMELGGGLILKPTMHLHIIANNRWDKDELIDFLEQRKDETIQMISLDDVPAQFTYEGDFAAGWLTRQNLIISYKDKNLYITDVSLLRNDDIAEDGYYTAILRMEMEIWVKEQL
jgi:hypothetical protein